VDACAPVTDAPRPVALGLRSPAGCDRPASGGRVRGVATASLAALIVVPFGLIDGGYFGRSFTAMTIALGSAGALAFLVSAALRVSRGIIATGVALALLGCWVALSHVWAVPGAGVELETRRCLMYLAAFGAVCAIVERQARRVFLLALTAAIVTVALVGLAMRAVSGVPLDPYYGGLLAEPVGYPNAVGILVAIGAVLAIGLQRAGDRGARPLQSAASLMILVLGLTGSRGGALALGAGIAVLAALSARPERWPCVGRAASALVVGGVVWGFTMAGGSLVLAAAAAAAIGAAVPTFGRRGALVLLCCLALAGGGAVLLDPPSTTSSFRSAYWGAALAEGRERPLLGSGAGSFFLSWREHRTADTSVRDAHSLYIETLSELGPLGLGLVLVVVAVPLGAAIRQSGDPIVASAGAGFAMFAFHAGLDWDWEMPVVTLVALACAGVVLAVDERPFDRGRR